MNYKEIPIDDSKGVKQFEAGDFVMVYNNGSLTGTICTIDYQLEYLEVKHKDDIECFNWRQCRKLEEVKPREFWISFTESDTVSDTGKLVPCFEGVIRTHKPGYPNDFLHVREVIE